MSDSTLATTPPTATWPDLIERPPLDSVGIAPENLRAEEPADEQIPELANTIDAAGVLYPLLVRPGRKGEQLFMALDGRRRLLALQQLAAEARIASDWPVPVQVVKDKGQQAAAIVVSNTQRAPVHVADVIVAIGKLNSLKMNSAKIAASLGYSEIEVRRLQRLASLPERAISALRRGRINLRTAKLLARITDADALEHFAQQAEAGYLYEHALMNHLNGRPGLDDPMFDLIGTDRYRKAGGRIDADLFGEFEDVVLDPDKLVGLWMDRVGFLVDAVRARDLTAYLQRDEVYRAPDDLEISAPNASARLDTEARAALDEAYAHADALAAGLSEGERCLSERNDDLLAYLSARLDVEVARVGAERMGGVGLYPSLGTGFDVQIFYKPVPEQGGDEGEIGWPDDAPETPTAEVRPCRPEVIVPPQVIDVEGRNHALHETYTDIATRGLIRSVADDPMAALTVTVARLFTVLALQGGVSTDQSASTLQARRYSRGSLAPVATLDGIVRERLEAKRKLYLTSGMRPIRWVDALAHGEKMELLAELTALSLDLREVNHTAVRRAARAEAAEIAEMTGHDITAYWTPDPVFLSQHTKGQLMGALTAMEADTAPTKGMRKDDLVGYVASVAAEKAWAPPALSLRLETPEIVPEAPTEAAEAEKGEIDGDDRGQAEEVDDAIQPAEVRLLQAA